MYFCCSKDVSKCNEQVFLKQGIEQLWFLFTFHRKEMAFCLILFRTKRILIALLVTRDSSLQNRLKNYSDQVMLYNFPFLRFMIIIFHINYTLTYVIFNKYWTVDHPFVVLVCLQTEWFWHIYLEKCWVHH